MADNKFKIGRNMRTPESRAFWEGVDKAAAEVDAWPQWKKDAARASISYDKERDYPSDDGDYSYWPGSRSYSYYPPEEKKEILCDSCKGKIENKQQVSEKLPWILKRFWGIK